MPALTRRRDPEGHHQVWLVYCGDVRVGTIGIRAGVPVDVRWPSMPCRIWPAVTVATRQAACLSGSSSPS
jgi:hypothetical protein